jgi:hypothetical protein
MDTKERLKQLQLTIDKLEMAYGKGAVIAVELTPEEIEIENKRLAILKLKRFWVNFVYYKQSTELWDKVDFEQIFENSEHVLKVSYSRHETGPYYAGETENANTLENNKKIIEKLREIYNKRFGEIESNDNTKFTTPERFRILENLGLTKSSIYKDLSETGKGDLIAKLLGISIDNGKKVKNGTYPIKEPINEKKIDAFFDKYNTKK